MRVKLNLSDYTFPGVPAPFAHQRVTTARFCFNLRHQCWNSIGTGKTYSCAWAVDYLQKLGAIKHVLLVAPISTLDVVWVRTFFRVNADLDIKVCKGVASKRREIITRISASNHPTVTLINPDGLHIIAELPAADLFDLVVVDESAQFRNAVSRRYDALSRLTGNYYEKRPGVAHGIHQKKGEDGKPICTDDCKPVTRRVLDKKRSERNWQRGLWAMTGSPQPEEPTDVWAISALVSPDRVPKHFSTFRDMTMIKSDFDHFKWLPRPNAAEIISDMLKGTVTRYTREECFDLPEEMPPYIHEVEMTAEQKEMVRKLKKEALLEVEAGLVKGVNAATIRNKFLQIFSGAVKAVNADGDDTLQKVDCEPKLTALDDLIESSSGPIIIGCQFVGAIARLAEKAERDKISYRVVTGDTSKDERLHIFDDLQANKYKLLIAQPKTISHGLTLTTSNVILWWSPIDSHETSEQFDGRITRPGQTRKTYTIYFVCSALERMIINNVGKKKERQDTLLSYLQSSEV